MKIALQYTHYGAEGHTTRILDIAQGLAQKEEIKEIHILNGGPPVTKRAPEKTVMHDIPYPIAGKEWFNAQDKVNIEPKKIKVRLYTQQKILDTIKPDIFITEYFPLGRSLGPFETMPLVLNIKKQYPDTRVIGSVGYPMLGLRTQKIEKYLRQYEKVMIHCPKNLDLNYVYQTLEEHNEQEKISEHQTFFESQKDVIKFTNYIAHEKQEIDTKKIRQKQGCADKKMVLVSRGGGAVNPGIISKGLLAKKYLPDAYKIIAVAGPSTYPKEWAVLKKIQEKIKGTEIHQSIENLFKHIYAADISVNMCGYNTSLDLLSARKKSIVMPFKMKTGKVSYEQSYRALLLKDRIGAKILDYHTLTAKQIAESVQEQDKQKMQANVDDAWFTGMRNTIKELLK